jgi:hypothetical protein
MRKITVGVALLSAALALVSCRPYGPDSPFNRPVPSNPKLLPNSSAMVDRLEGWGPVQQLMVGGADTPSDYFHPIYAARKSDPVYTIHCLRWTSACEIEGHKVRIPSAARPAGGADGHMAVLQRDWWEYDFWQVKDRPAGGGTLLVSHGGRTKIDGDGLGSDATAAEFGLAAGLIRGDQLAAGEINHALFVHVRCTSGRSVYPAAPGTTGSVCSDTTNAPPLGARLWLAMSNAQIAALAVPEWKKTVLRALHRYGGYVGDTTGGHVSWGLQTISGSTYTSFGEADPMVGLAHRLKLGKWSGKYYLDVDSGVEWSRYLRVLDPCVGQVSCAR